MPSVKPVELDGSTLEGGGQLVRVALSLSAITGIPVSIYNIRANRGSAKWIKSKRPQPERKVNDRSRGSHSSTSRKADGGLKESHLAAVLWLAAKCDASLDGAEHGSRELEFTPGGGFLAPGSKHSSKTFKADGLVDFEHNVIELKNPGSVWLILQAILPYLIFGQCKQDNKGPTDGQGVLELTLRGGTNVPKSMSADYFIHVLLPTLELIGVPRFQVEVTKRGWAGNEATTMGEVKLRVTEPLRGGFKLPAFKIVNRGEIEKISVKIVAHPYDDTGVFEVAFQELIAKHFGDDIQIDMLETEDSGAPQRLYILLIAHTTTGWRLGSDFLGSGKRPKNDVEKNMILANACETVVRGLKREVDREGCVDEYLQDQLVLFQALSTGKSIVHGGEWKCSGLDEDHEECGDPGGSLHTKTVRWVCKQMLKRCGDGVHFRDGGVCEGGAWNGRNDANGSLNQRDELAEDLKRLDLAKA